MEYQSQILSFLFFFKDVGYFLEDIAVNGDKEFLYIWRALKDHLRVIPPMFRYHLEQNTDGIHYGHWNNLKFADESWFKKKQKDC